MDETVDSYGIVERNTSDSPDDLVLEEFSYQGFSVVDSGYSPADLARLRAAFDRVAQVQRSECDALESIGEANVVRCPLAYDDAFVDLATNPRMHSITSKILGSNFVLLMQNGVANPPDAHHYQSRWHRDLTYQHWVSTRCLAVSWLLCLDPFTVETGCTYGLPGTHMFERFPSEPYIRKHQAPLEAPAGSFLLMHAMMYHRAGKNTSAHLRRGVNHVIGLPFLSQQIDLAHILGDRFQHHADYSRFFGYKWRPQPSVMQWRQQKLDGLKR